MSQEKEKRLQASDEPWPNWVTIDHLRVMGGIKGVDPREHPESALAEEAESLDSSQPRDICNRVTPRQESP